ncbi:unnamed protein product [Porites lobata]|uniref:Uncharacterized protein n=1 Tax=Porites lobata TaxID=104759 RepID=A0ABN8NBZ0_9CNID|nr:unnamed protein product [Porites lobata]
MIETEELAQPIIFCCWDSRYPRYSIANIFFLHRLPHVITVCLKTTAQIEVVVANKDKALEESEELRQDFFEVVEAMAVHLM